MNFRQLEAFVYVVKNRSFSKAAEAIFISQPTVSVHIASLEDELGVPLIVRAPREIFPTEAGKIFYNYALQIIKLRDKSMEEIKKYSDRVYGSLEIASSTVPAQYILPKVISKFAKEYPSVFVSIKQFDTMGVVEKVESMETEVGVCGAKAEKTNCVFTPFATDELVIITPNTQEYKNIPDDEIKNMILRKPFVSREKGSGTKSETEHFLSQNGININNMHTMVQMQSTESVIQAVKSGLGFSIVSKYAVQDYLKFGDILSYRIPDFKMERTFYIVTKKNRPLTKQAEIFINVMKNFNIYE